jgi:hypothetical protein
MNQTQPHVCPHYNAYTLWWMEQEGTKLTCPPDFQRCCLDNPFENLLLSDYTWESILDDAQTHGLLMEEEDLYVPAEDMEYDITDETLDHLDYIEQIRQGIQDSMAEYLESDFNNTIKSA